MVVTARGQLAHIGNVIVDAPEALRGRHRVNLLQVRLILGRGGILQCPTRSTVTVCTLVEFYS